MSRKPGPLVKETDRKPPFKELNHTADLRVEIVGKDEHELFRNAVESLYVLLGLPVVRDRRRCLPEDGLRIEGQDPEETLVHLLGELLYRATVERRQFVVDTLSVSKGEEGALVVSASGCWCSVTEEEMRGKREIKAVTYHDLQIRETQKGLSARVVMDL